MTGRLIFFISIGILLCCVAGGVFFWWPKMQLYFGLEGQISAVDRQLEEKIQYYSKLKDISEKMINYEDSLAKINSAFPSDPNVSIPPLIVYMLNVSAESGVTVKDVNIGTTVSEEATDNGLNEVKYELSGSAASYAVFKNLIANIFNNARMIDTDSISLTVAKPSGEKEAEGKAKEEPYQFKMSLRTNFYLEREIESVGPQGKTIPSGINP